MLAHGLTEPGGQGVFDQVRGALGAFSVLVGVVVLLATVAPAGRCGGLPLRVLGTNGGLACGRDANPRTL